MEKVWLNSYPDGVPETINPDAFTSIIDAFNTYTEKFGTFKAFTNLGSTITYHQLNALARDVAAYFQQTLQLQKGDRIALMMPNCLQYPVLIFGALMAGLTVVNVNPLYTARELKNQMADAKVSAIVVLNNFAHTVEQVLPAVSIPNVIVTEMGDLMGALKGGIVNAVVKHVKRMVPSWSIPQAIPLKAVFADGKKLSFDPVDIKNTDIAFLQYTGGTTGVPKGAILTHRNMIANVLQAVTWIRSINTPGQEIVLGALPLYHIFSLTICCFCFLCLGAECLLVTNPRDMDDFVKILRKNPVSMFIGVNTLFNGLLNHPKLHTIDFSNIKLNVGGGMAVQKAVAVRWREVTGKILLEGYGLTEASPVVSINPLNLDYFNESAGLPVPGTDIQVRDADGRALGVDEEGELWVKGPQVMQGYWNKPEETDKVLDKDGWLRTGDIVRVDERGFIYIIDRAKDMILVSGFNVYPNEIEGVLALHPAIVEVAVVGVPNEQTGEMVKAFIVKNDPALDEQTIIDFARESLTAYKIPKRIEFRDELPKTNVGKVLRRALR